MIINPVTRSFLEHKIAERQAHYDLLGTYRDYTNGDQAVQLTDKQKILIVGDDGTGHPNSDPEFWLNVCSPILDAEVDRLEVQSISVVMPDNDALTDELSARAWQWWKASRMDEGQQNAHFAACRDADSFAFVFYDDEKRMPRIAINPAYDGENNGADVFYVDDDPNQPEAAIKVWTVNENVKRKNIYYPDRVEFWINSSGIQGANANAGWRPLRFSDDDWTPAMQEAPTLQATSLGEMATVAWWTDTGRENGRPLGLPIMHFRHQARGLAYGRSTIADVAPGLQDAVNRSGVSLMAAAQLTGFKHAWATGYDPKDDGVLYISPASITYSTDYQTRFGDWSETNLMQLIEVMNAYIKNAATLTSTPLSFFNLGGQAPAEGSQKALEMGLLAKTRRNQTSFGNTWEDVIRYMIKLDSVSRGGQTALTWDQIDALEISVTWEPAEMRNELVEAQVAKLHKDLLVPQKFIWRKLGYTEDDIDEFEQELDVKRGQVIGQLTQKLREMETVNNGANGLADRTVVNAGGGNGTQPVGV